MEASIEASIEARGNSSSNGSSKSWPSGLFFGNWEESADWGQFAYLFL